MASAPRVLIVGGGIAGFSLAVALGRRGLRDVELVERSPVWAAGGAGITLHANAGRVLRALRLADQIGDVAAVLPRWTFRDAAGNRLCSTDLAEMWADVGPCLGITRVRLQEVLRGAAHHVRIRSGVAFSGLAPTADGVRVTFSDHSSASFDLVVGADGIRSRVRTVLFGTTPVRDEKVTGWRCVVDARPAGVHDLVLFLGDACFFGLVPVGDGGTYGFAGMTGPRADEPLAGRRERLRARFADFASPVQEFLDALDTDEQVHVDAIASVELDRWHRGRVVVIGDAAHALAPHMGEGGAMALEDAAVLAELLDGADSIPHALGAFEERRRPRVQLVQDHSGAAARAWAMPPAVRDRALAERGDQMLRERYRPLIVLP